MLERCGYMLKAHVELSGVNILMMVFIALLITPPIIAEFDQAADEGALFVHRLAKLGDALQREHGADARAWFWMSAWLNVNMVLVWMGLQVSGRVLFSPRLSSG